MINVSQLFKDYSDADERQIEIKAVIGGYEYSGDKIVSAEYQDSLMSGDDLALGVVQVAKLTIEIKSGISIAPNAQILLKVRLNGEDGYTEWIDYGTFYIDERNLNNGVWTYTAYDKLISTNQIYESNITYPATFGAVLTEILATIGMTATDATTSTITASTFVIPYKDTEITINEMLAQMAGALGGFFRSSKSGQLELVTFGQTVSKSFSRADYSAFRKTNVNKAITKTKIIYNKNGEYIETGAGDESATMTIYNPLAFFDTDIKDAIHAAAISIAYAPYEMTSKGFLYLESGDKIQAVDVYRISWDEADIAWQDAEFAWNGEYLVDSYIGKQTLRFTGGLLANYGITSKSNQQSEFSTKGPLTRQVNQIDQVAIKDEEVYNGVVFSKTNGITVNRSDGKATINLDALYGVKIENDSESVFSVDIDGNLIIKGNITMTGGSISWADITAPEYDDIGGTKPPSDADNTTSVIGANRLTYIDQNGIYTGTLTADQINAISGITLGAGATINWGDLETPLDYTDVVGTKPPVDADNTTTVIGVNRLTKIDQNGIYTGTLTAAQVNAVAISASSITTGTLNGITAKIGNAGYGKVIMGTVSNAGAVIIADSNENWKGYIKESSSDIDFVGYYGINISAASNDSLTLYGGTARLYSGTTLDIDAGTTLNLSAPSGINMESQTDFYNGVAIQNGLSVVSGPISFASVPFCQGVNMKISGDYTGYDTEGDHNHGIPDGTVLMVNGGGTVTFRASGGRSHRHIL